MCPGVFNGPEGFLSSKSSLFCEMSLKEKGVFLALWWFLFPCALADFSVREFQSSLEVTSSWLWLVS